MKNLNEITLLFFSHCKSDRPATLTHSAFVLRIYNIEYKKKIATDEISIPNSGRIIIGKYSLESELWTTSMSVKIASPQNGLILVFMANITIFFVGRRLYGPNFEDVLERCNQRYHRLRLLANKKWGPSPATLIQIYKQCVRPIFEYGSLSTITASDSIISKIQRLQNQFIRLALRLPKYIIPRLLHDSTGLPYVKDRLLTCAAKSLDRIAQNP